MLNKLLCFLGLHEYKQIGVPSFYKHRMWTTTYKCTRCSKIVDRGSK